MFEKFKLYHKNSITCSSPKDLHLELCSSAPWDLLQLGLFHIHEEVWAPPPWERPMVSPCVFGLGHLRPLVPGIQSPWPSQSFVPSSSWRLAALEFPWWRRLRRQGPARFKCKVWAKTLFMHDQVRDSNKHGDHNRPVESSDTSHHLICIHMHTPWFMCSITDNQYVLGLGHFNPSQRYFRNWKSSSYLVVKCRWLQKISPKSESTWWCQRLCEHLCLLMPHGSL